MTQPPQPPNEPPQGGYGFPQGPSPGGYGQPQSPPGGANPGYPPPAAPPPAAPPSLNKPAQAPPPPGQPPQAPPPPGQPPTSPTGYGHPQPSTAAAQQPTVAAQPAVQPGGQQYGYPAQQPYGGYQQATQPQPAVAGGGRRINAQVAIIVSAVVAIALIVGGGVWYSSSHSGDEDQANSGQSGGSTGSKDGKGEGPQGGGDEKVPDNTSAKVLLQVPAPVVTDQDDVRSVKGSWLHGKYFVKPNLNELVGYDTTTGKQAWTMPLDGQTCAASPEVTDDGIAAVVYEEHKLANKDDFADCTKISAFDTATGEKLWTKEAKVGPDEVASYEEVSISGDVVAVGGGTDGGSAFDLKTGELKWAPQASDQCHDVGYRGGEQLVAVRTCGEYDNPKLSVELLAADGKPKWSYKLPDGIDNAKVLSTKPVVFGVDTGGVTNGAGGVTDVFSMDDATGQLRQKITMEPDTYSYDCHVNVVHECHGLVVGNGKLYVPTKEHDGSGSSYGRTNEIVSFDLATGKATGERADAGDDYTMFPVRMDGSNVLAYKDGPYDKGAQIVTLDGNSMKETKLLETPASKPVMDALSFMVPESAELLYEDGRLFLGKELISKPFIEDEKEYAAIGFAD